MLNRKHTRYSLPTFNYPVRIMSKSNDPQLPVRGNQCYNNSLPYVVDWNDYGKKGDKKCINYNFTKADLVDSSSLSQLHLSTTLLSRTTNFLGNPLR